VQIRVQGWTFTLFIVILENIEIFIARVCGLVNCYSWKRALYMGSLCCNIGCYFLLTVMINRWPCRADLWTFTAELAEGRGSPEQKGMHNAFSISFSITEIFASSWCHQSFSAVLIVHSRRIFFLGWTFWLSRKQLPLTLKILNWKLWKLCEYQSIA